jgi:Protein of unknown function (DUF3176)
MKTMAQLNEKLQTDHIPRLKSKHRHRLQWLMSDSWALECLAISISILALVGIAIMLGVYNRKPLSSWSHVISLNTALSTLGTVMKGFMMIPIGSCLGQLKWLWYAKDKRTLHDFQIFDQASRGPWGSTMLLFRLKFWHLASVGAVVTVLGLASDSFVQQSVSYPQWDVPQPHQIAAVPFAQKYMTYYNGTYGEVADLVRPMMAAIYDGVLASNLTRSGSSLQPTCASGNCTSPPYTSLGVCSMCADVTSMLRYSTGSDSTSFEPFHWTLPNGHQLNAAGDYTWINITSSRTYFDGGLGGNLSLNSNALWEYLSVGTISNISVILGTGYVGPGTPLNTTQALDCTLFFCAHAYKSSTNLNIFTENITGVLKKPTWSVTPPPKIINIFDRPNATFQAHFPHVETKDLTFTLDLNSRDSLTGALASIEGEVQVSLDNSEPYWTTDIAQGFYYRGITPEAVVETVENVATALTNAVRQISQTNIIGTTWALESHIVVQWLWLLLPLIMVLLALLFLVFVMLQTGKSGIPSWRSSALAVMKHGVNTTMLENDPASKLDPAGDGVGKETVGELEIWAEKVDVRLQRRGVNACGYGLM